MFELQITRNISPNWITLISLLTGLSIIPALWLQQITIALVLLLVSGFCDTLDGTLARLTQRTSVLGTLFDIMSDRIVESAIVFGLFLLNPLQRGGYVIAMLSSILICVTSFLIVGIFTSNQSQKGFYYSPGLMERTEAFIFFILMLLWPDAFNALASLFTFLVFFTAGHRIWQFIHQQSTGAVM